jgi:hypothetical protein
MACEDTMRRNSAGAPPLPSLSPTLPPSLPSSLPPYLGRPRVAKGRECVPQNGGSIFLPLSVVD